LSDVISNISANNIFKCLIREDFTVPVVQKWNVSGGIGGMILTGKTEVLGEKHYSMWVVNGMSMERWWNDTDRGN
jgi:hypothetical protein